MAAKVGSDFQHTEVVKESSQASVQPSGSLERGLAILRVFSSSQRELALTDIANLVGLTLSTTHRIVATLAEMGYLERDPVTKRYRPGLQVLQLGFAALAGLELRRVALPVLRRLSEALESTVNCGILDGNEVVFVARLARDQIITTMLHEGSRLPAHCSSMGKCLLAYLPDEQRREAIARLQLVSYTPYTITNPERLEEECRRIRERGFAVIDQELAIGHRGVAAPVWNRAGQAAASINVALPASMVEPEELAQHWASKLIAASGEISMGLGWSSNS